MKYLLRFITLICMMLSNIMHVNASESLTPSEKKEIIYNDFRNGGLVT